MKCIVNAAALSFAMIWPAIQSTPAAAQIPEGLQNDQIEISYVEPKNPAFRPIYDVLKKRQVLEELRAFMAPLNMPHKLLVKTDECGGRTTAQYEHDGPVTICYEFVASIERLAPKETTELGVSRNVALTGAFVMGALHEMAHAVFDILEVPVWGREDDAADKLAAFIMLQFGPDVALTTFKGAAHFLDASNTTWAAADFANVQSPEAQRYYNYLCLAHGGPASEAFKPFLTQVGFIKLARSKLCIKEYADMRWAWGQTIGKFVDSDLMDKVQHMNVLFPEDMK